MRCLTRSNSNRRVPEIGENCPGETNTMFYNRAQAMEFASDFWDRPCGSDKHPGGALGLDSARDVPIGAVWDQRKAPPAKFDLRFVYNPNTDRDDLVAVPKAGGGAAPVPVLDGEK